MGDIIPSMVDGLNEVERLSLYWALELCSEEIENERRRVNVGELKMATFRSSSTYLPLLREEAIVRLAQNFTGANNVNLFEPLGNFGSRYQGPLDLRAGVTFTQCMEIRLNPITRLIFVKEDVSIAIKELEGCSFCQEMPTSLLPIIPLILVNGSDGNGGPSSRLKSCIPKFKLEDVIANLKLYLHNKEMLPMIPWFKGFQGKVELSDDKSYYRTTGVIAHIDSQGKTVTISELPIGVWTRDYKTWLASQQWVQFVKDLSMSKESVLLEVTLSNEAWQPNEAYLMEKLELCKTCTLSKMRALDPLGDLLDCENPLEFIEFFADYRSRFYEKRKDMLLDNVSSDLASVESSVSDCIGVALSCYSVIKHAMSGLRECAEVAKLSKLLASLYENLDRIEQIVLVNSGMENDVVLSFSEAVTLKNSELNLSEDNLIALDTVCYSLNQLKGAISEMRAMCIKRKNLKDRLCQLQKEDYLSLWFNDLKQLELSLKNRHCKEDKERPPRKTIEASTQRRSRGRKRKTESSESSSDGGSNSSSSN